MADGAVGVYKSWCQKLSSTRPEGKFKWSVQRYSTSSSSTGFLWARYVARSTLKQAQEQEVLYPVEFKQYLLIQSCFIASQWTLKETEESIEGHVINFFKAPNKIILLWKGALPLHPYLRNFVKGTQVRIKRSIKSLSSWLVLWLTTVSRHPGRNKGCYFQEPDIYMFCVCMEAVIQWPK